MAEVHAALEHAAGRARAGEEFRPDGGPEQGDRSRYGCENRQCRRDDSPPMPSGDKGDRQQQTEVRFAYQTAKQHAGQYRAPWKQEQSPAKQARRQKGVLAVCDSPKHGGKGQADPERQWLREDPPQCRQIPGKPERKPNRERRQIGQQRQRVHDKQGWRRIIPRVEIRCWGLCDSLFQRKKNGRIIDRVRVTVEQGVGGGPKPQEIRADRPAHRIGGPISAHHPCHHGDRTGNQRRRVPE